MIRPVNYLPLGKEDCIGPFEQPHMTIACTPQDIISGETTHVEGDPTNILSIVANMTPFSDFNQSPRNMYQCQMSKQAMGTPGTASRYRTDNKSYRLQTGQSPIVKAPLYDEYGLDNFPNGFNAVVAVISYTGYDMDDAMIINKSSYERGFAYGTVYKMEQYGWKDKTRGDKGQNLFGFAEEDAVSRVMAEYHNTMPPMPTPIYKPEPGAPSEAWEAYEVAKAAYEIYKAAYEQDKKRVERNTNEQLFALGKVQSKWFDHIDMDGLPVIGQKVQEGDPIVAYYDVNKRETKVFTYHGSEVAYVEEVRLLGLSSPVSQLYVHLLTIWQRTRIQIYLARKSLSSSAFRVVRRSETSSPPATGRKASVPKSGPPKTCPSPKAVCSQMSSSTLMPSRPV